MVECKASKEHGYLQHIHVHVHIQPASCFSSDLNSPRGPRPPQVEVFPKHNNLDAPDGRVPLDDG